MEYKAFKFPNSRKPKTASEVGTWCLGKGSQGCVGWVQTPSWVQDDTAGRTLVCTLVARRVGRNVFRNVLMH